MFEVIGSATRAVTIEQFYKEGRHQELDCKISDFRILRNKLNTFARSRAEVSPYVEKRNTPRFPMGLTYITNIEKFIEIFNQFYWKQPEYVDSGWSGSALDCLENGGICAGCFYNSIESLTGKCKMHATAKKLESTLGSPYEKDKDYARIY